MTRERLLILIAASAIIAAVVTYQIRRPRPATPATVQQNVPAAASSAPAPVAPAVRPSFPPQPNTPAARVSIPNDGWGRNPFLTLDEIARLNQPPPEIVIPAPEPPPAPVMPQYEVTAIILNKKGAWAIVSPNSRIVRVGDRLGVETVKQIKEEAIVLEHDGQIREVALKPPGAAIPAAPKGEQP